MTSLSCFSQKLIDFENNNLDEWLQSIANHWEISNANPISGSFSLHHAYDNPSAGKDQISFAYPKLIDFSDTISWTFLVKHGYNPSSSNNWTVYLCSDRSSPEMQPDGLANGIAIGVNFTGSDDLLKLYSVDNKNITTILQTSFNVEDTIGDHIAKFKIERYPDGNWNVYASNYELQTIPDLVGSCKYLQITDARYFGIYYEYSSAQDRKLWIDDVRFDMNFIDDIVSPKIDTFYLASQKQVNVCFNEPINYSQASLSFSEPSIVIDSITFDDKVIHVYIQNMPVNKTVQLVISGINDIYGNKMADTTLNLFYYLPNPYDVIVTEVMSDPEPIVGLPPYEYIELYNQTNSAIDLSKWQLSVGTKKLVLPTMSIQPYGYIILTSKNAKNAFSTLLNVSYCITDNYMLINEGAAISIKDSLNHLISVAQYSDDWYDDKYKSEGGWSLEIIDKNNPCGGADNWLASNDPSGGTPGTENSNNANNPDNIAPELKYITVPNDSVVLLTFSEFLDSSKTLIPENYSISPTIGNPVHVTFGKEGYKTISLTLQNKLVVGKTYTLKVNNNVCDCVGNWLPMLETKVAIPENTDSLDVVLNEILFNSYPEGSEFVEIFNRSNKVVDAGKLMLATVDSASGKTLNYCSFAPDGLPLFPKQYLAVTNNYKMLEQDYTLKEKHAVFEQGKFPSLDDKQGTVAIKHKNGKTIDQVRYYESMHYILLNSREGVSLERLSPETGSMVESNWHSASQTAGFATPGYENSQKSNAANTLKSEISITPEVFTPDNDGIDDMLTISISPEDIGYSASITIFSSSGIQVKRLIKQEYLGTTNTFTWDGTSDEPKLQPPGIYIIYTRLISDKGVVKEYKNTCVLGYK